MKLRAVFVYMPFLAARQTMFHNDIHRSDILLPVVPLD
jgi:hypothetical protein